jgi:hypothetical protein
MAINPDVSIEPDDDWWKRVEMFRCPCASLRMRPEFMSSMPTKAVLEARAYRAPLLYSVGGDVHCRFLRKNLQTPPPLRPSEELAFVAAAVQDF